MTENSSRNRDSQTSLALQIDQASDAFEGALRNGQWPDILEFLGSRGYPISEPMFVELLSIEIEYCQRANRSISKEEYDQRYPDFCEEIDVAFAASQTRGSYADSTGKQESHAYRGRYKVGESISVEDRQFDLLRNLGEGSFATVFLARQPQLRRLVALKISSFEADECRTLATFDHPNIVRVYDEISLPENLTGIYMEYVPGGSLADVIRDLRSRPLENRSGTLLFEVIDEALRERSESIGASSSGPLAEASWGEVVCVLGAQIAEALEYADHRRTQHRDVKPANILLMPDGTPKLVDFNIAYSALVEGADPDERFGGSLAYMSPEQLLAASRSMQTSAKDLDGRSDIYSLGVVLWELLTGKHPYDDSPVHKRWTLKAAEMAKTRTVEVGVEKHSALAEFQPPPGLAEVLARALKPNRDDRYANAGELAHDLRLCLHPEARRLLKPPDAGLVSLVRRFPFRCLVVLALLPSIVLSVCNVAYDYWSIAQGLGWGLPHFLLLMGAVKVVFYGVGIVIGVRWAWPLFTATWNGPPTNEAERKRIRRRTLYFGDVIFWISFGAWSLSGIVIPACFWIVEGRLAIQNFFHFFLAHVLCGLIAGTLAAFPLAYLVSRLFYPMILSADAISASERSDVSRLQRRQKLYVSLTFAAPFLALFALVVAGDNYKLPFYVLSGLAFVTLVVQHSLSPATIENFNALMEALGSRRKRLR